MIKNLYNEDFSLVLSGGGALGIAHLGVIHNLEKENLIPSEIIGTSMGGIIGACMAIGMAEDAIYKQIVTFTSVGKWMKFSFSGNAIVDNSKIETIFYTLFGDRKMSDTQIPLKLICTNIINGKKRVFSQEDDIYIKDAVLATMAIPGIFTEHKIGDAIYVDGFLCENLGVSEASYQTILAIDVLGKHALEEELPNNFFKTTNVIEMLERSMRFLIYNQSQKNLAQSTKDIILIEPKTYRYSTFQFHKHESLRALGLGLIY